MKPAYIEFMKMFPKLNDFLEIKLEMIEDLIKSLGLLKRAKFLHTIAGKLKYQFDGKIPSSLADLNSLKGIGKYTSNAILCFGFNERRPLIETNFIRIYDRVFSIKSKTKTPKNDPYLWQISEELLPENNYVIFNYGIIDLGKEICTPKHPKCNDCVLQQLCMHYKSKI